jgi:Smg protein
MFDVLIHVYRNYGAIHACPDADALRQSLAEAGFDQGQVGQAMAWLHGLACVMHDSVTLQPPGIHAFRVFTDLEIHQLGPDAAAFLATLESHGELTPSQREIVIDRALMLESPVALAQLKVIVLMVLWSQQADIDWLLLDELLDAGPARAVQ